MGHIDLRERYFAGNVLSALSRLPHLYRRPSSLSGKMYGWIRDISATKAADLANRCFELTSFLVDVLKIQSIDSRYTGTLTYHDSCSSLREWGIKQQPRILLQRLADCQFNEMPNTESCCGFGGTFCIKYPAISTRMVDDKIGNVQASGADTLVAADLGCLLNLAGRIKRLGLPIKVFHVAEILAGMAEGPGIGEDEST